MLPSATDVGTTSADDTDGQIDMDVVVAKILTLIIITVLTVLSGLLPCRLLQHFGRSMLKRRRTFDHAVAGAKCFSGGVFLGVCFLHLMPETRNKVDLILEHLGSRSKYPLAELLTIAGFFGPRCRKIIDTTYSLHSHTLEVVVASKYFESPSQKASPGRNT